MNTPNHTAYKDLEKRFEKIITIGNITEILHWDMNTYMPKGALKERAQQLGVLESISHNFLNNPDFKDLLTQAQQEVPSLSPWQNANLQEMYRTVIHTQAIPEDLAVKAQKIQAEAQSIWGTAQKKNDFLLLQPYLEQVLKTKQEIAQRLSQVLECTPYDALLDRYERGLRKDVIDPLFQEVREFLSNFIAKVGVKQKSPPLVFTDPVPLEKQEKLCKTVMELLGFDRTRGCLAQSKHPFCAGPSTDTRITVRYDENTFIPAFMAVIHETGHALYEQNRPQEWCYQSVGAARGMAMHESQSLIMEKQACRSPEFIYYITPLIQQTLEQQGPEWSAENLLHHLHHVQAGYIRVDADEVTYPLHILLRYELEQAMLEGELSVAELPEAWNEAMERLLGLRPPTDSVGCLQDPHWAAGEFGYFPTYALGAFIAAQLFTAACQQNTKIHPSLAQGNFSPLRSWLQENIHRYGCLYSTQDLLRQATGTPLTLNAFKQHLTTRYL